MITREELENRYSQHSNHELMGIIDNKSSYTELAIDVAMNELANRDVLEEDIILYKTERFIDVLDYLQKNIVDDLKLWEKIIFYVMWFPFVNFILSRRYLEDDYILKLRQANYYSWSGFLSFFILLPFIGQNNLANILIFLLYILLFVVVLRYDELFNRKVIKEKLYQEYILNKK